MTMNIKPEWFTYPDYTCSQVLENNWPPDSREDPSKSAFEDLLEQNYISPARGDIMQRFHQNSNTRFLLVEYMNRMINEGFVNSVPGKIIHRICSSVVRVNQSNRVSQMSVIDPLSANQKEDCTQVDECVSETLILDWHRVQFQPIIRMDTYYRQIGKILACGILERIGDVLCCSKKTKESIDSAHKYDVCINPEVPVLNLPSGVCDLEMVHVPCAGDNLLLDTTNCLHLIYACDPDNFMSAIISSAPQTQIVYNYNISCLNNGSIAKCEIGI